MTKQEFDAPELIKQVDDILKSAELPDRHTFYQIEKFIIGKETTAHAQLWQIIREMDSRISTIDSLKNELETAEDDLELFDIKIERLNRKIRQEGESESEHSDLNIRQCEISIRKLQREKHSLVTASRKARKKLTNVLEELAFLHMCYEKTLDTVGELKPWDDAESQKELWHEKLLEEFNLRVVLQRPLDPEFVRTVLCLDEDALVKRHMTKLVDNIQQKMLEQNSKQTGE